jgi:hypothetical protein
MFTICSRIAVISINSALGLSPSLSRLSSRRMRPRISSAGVSLRFATSSPSSCNSASLSVRLHQQLAAAYLSDGEFARALTEANTATQANDPYGDYYLRASIYEAWGKPKEAADVRLQAHNGLAAELKKEKKPSMFDDMTYPELVFISTSPGNGDQQAAREIIKLLS